MSTYRLAIEVKIDDPERLRQAAEVRAVEEGLRLEDWRETRASIEDDLIMLFDPGISPPGTSIIQTTTDEL